MKDIDETLIVNRYNLAEKTMAELIDTIEWYLKKIRQCNLNEFNNQEKMAYIGVISEAYPLLKDKEFFLKKCQIIFVKFEKEIRENNLRRLSLHEGLCNLALYADTLSYYSGCYKKMCNSLRHMIYKQANIYTDEITNNLNNRNFMDFDVISGLTGIANYLMNHYSEEESVDILTKIAKYFVLLVQNKVKDNRIIPGWFEKKENNPFCVQDYIDFSISHGIAGPLYILVELLEKNIIVPGQYEAISKIIEKYAFIGRKSNNMVWSGKLVIDKYFAEDVEISYGREGWCYGSIPVAKILSNATKHVSNKYIKEISKKRLEQILEMKADELGLDLPILCHGYAGNSAILRCLYEQTLNPQYLEHAKTMLKHTTSFFNKESDYGFPYNEQLNYHEGRKIKSIDTLNFLEGTAGIVMEILSWVKSDSYFEKMLLI